MIRLAEKQDLSKLVEIYNQAIQTKCCTGDLDPFTIESRTKWFEDHTPDKYPIYVYEINGEVVGYCTLSPYRAGRRAFDSVAEISYYIDFNHHKKGIAQKFMDHALENCKRLNISTLITYILEVNSISRYIMEKYGFELWGFLPDIVDLDGKICGHTLYGKKL